MQLYLMVKIYNSVVLDIGVYITTENDHSCITKYSFYYIASQVLERMDSFVCYVLIQLVLIFFGKDVCSRYLWHTAKGENVPASTLMQSPILLLPCFSPILAECVIVCREHNEN